MRKSILLFLAVIGVPAYAQDLRQAIESDYEEYLGDLFVHFHQNPELSTVENRTAERMAVELRSAGFTVTEGVGGTGLVGIMENGPGPLVMMRADMDGLPVLEQSGLPYSSRATQLNPVTGETVPVMHACGHDVHITSLVGTARQMSARRDQWSGTLMLLVQPAEERGIGAQAMEADGLYERFGRPDFALGFHVAAENEAGLINVQEGSPYAGVDTVDITVRGIGAHGASPHTGVDPILLASQIVVSLQTLVSRNLSPREAGVVTVGSFHAGSAPNIISDRAHLRLTVRNTNMQTRELLLSGIDRIATNLGRAAGLPDDLLPIVTVTGDSTPPMINNAPLVQRLKGAWGESIGADVVVDIPPSGMGGEDFAEYGIDPDIPIAFWRVGGTPKQDFERAAAGGEPVPSHHSPLFKIAPQPSITAGVESTVVALLELLQ